MLQITPAKIETQSIFELMARVVCDSVNSEHTRRAYHRALVDFLKWHEENNRPGLNKMVIQAYISELKQRGQGAAGINQRLAAIRKLVKEAADNGLIDESLVSGILRIEGIRKEGKRLGNWLKRDDAQKLINSPDNTTLKGIRDRALLAVLAGCGLRRSEVTGLTFGHIQQREGRWVIVDLVGKRNKTRSVPMPSWTKSALDAWTMAAGFTLASLTPHSTAFIFRPINKGGRLAGDRMTSQSIFEIVKLYADPLGLQIAPHDLRRTFAKLARKGGADLKQIQLTLGHASIKTTEIYLGEEQNLTDAPCDRLGLTLTTGD